MDNKLPDRSEYEGGGVMPNTVFPTSPDTLTASDKLRLQSLTGQEDDSNAPIDPWFWQGGQYSPDALQGVEQAKRDRLARNANLRREENRRYRESPY